MLHTQERNKITPAVRGMFSSLKSSPPTILALKGLSHEIDFDNIAKN
jgi:hypothetical protein